MTYWVLKERATERLLPSAKVATGVEFGDKGPPRLFVSKNAASNALNCWRMGFWHLAEGEDWGLPEPSAWGGNKAIAERRQATEVDIVEMSLVPCAQTRGI